MEVSAFDKGQFVSYEWKSLPEGGDWKWEDEIEENGFYKYESHTHILPNFELNIHDSKEGEKWLLIYQGDSFSYCIVVPDFVSFLMYEKEYIIPFLNCKKSKFIELNNNYYNLDNISRVSIYLRGEKFVPQVFLENEEEGEFRLELGSYKDRKTAYSVLKMYFGSNLPS